MPVIGLKEASSGEHKIPSVTPVADDLLGSAQVNKILDKRIVPPVDGLIIERLR